MIYLSAACRPARSGWRFAGAEAAGFRFLDQFLELVDGILAGQVLVVLFRLILVDRIHAVLGSDMFVLSTTIRRVGDSKVR